MSKTTSREIHLKRRPVGMPTEENFELVKVPVPSPDEGEVLVRNIYISVDPYMRGRMIQRRSYTPSFQLGKVMAGGAVGQIVSSNNPSWQAGEYVMSMHGWREWYVSDGANLNRVDPSVAPIQAFLGTFGMPGWTAYVGLLDIGALKKGETVFVSAAAGAVGAVACQIAKLKGCRVIGSAGSERKIKWLQDELGIDATLNYKHTADLASELGKHVPDGLDLYFDNVGGDHLEAALTHMNDFGRVVCCGMISQYNATKPSPAPRNLTNIVTRRLTLKGFIVSDHLDQLPRFYADMQAWREAGQIQWQETIVEGLENAPTAFIGLFKGENLGKMLVKVGPDPAI